MPIMTKIAMTYLRKNLRRINKYNYLVDAIVLHENGVFMTQKDAVFSAVSQVLSSNNITFTANSTNASAVLNRELRLQINGVLVQQFLAGSVELSEDAKNKLNDESELRAYISGLVSNWLRKDPRLNGGTVLATTSSKSTLTKSIKSDPQLQALRKLHSAQVEPAKRLEIQAHIDRRIAELSE